VINSDSHAWNLLEGDGDYGYANAYDIVGAAPRMTPVQEDAARRQFVANYARLLHQKQLAMAGVPILGDDAAKKATPPTPSPWMAILNAGAGVAANALSANHVGPFSAPKKPDVSKSQPSSSPWPRRLAIGGAVVGGVTVLALVVRLLRRPAVRRKSEHQRR
jgi:hypothetical protein